ncbi:MAG: polysaccharide deacetylase family protein [Acidaminococcaceae bacterium]|nr:polysaccharide deacetylase family protein [Acidaminococcaceae bacterium]
MRVLYLMGAFYLAALLLLWAGRFGTLRRKTAAVLSVLCLLAGSGALAAAVYPAGNLYGPTVNVLPDLNGNAVASTAGSVEQKNKGTVAVGLKAGMEQQDAGSSLPVRRKCMALTFDDGPYPPYTGRLLDVLKEKKIHATFFLVGEQARLHPDLVRRMVDEGHTVGLHAFRHRDFLKLTEEEKEKDLQQGKEILQSITGKKPNYWRPPHGFRDSSVMKIALAKDLQVVNWSVIPRDWTGIDKQEIYNRVMDKAEDGAIVLLHDGDSPLYKASRQATVDAVGPLIDSLREKGYHLVSLEEYAGR